MNSVILPPQAKHGKSPPSWVTPDVMETLKVLKNFGFQILFGVYKRKEKCRLQGGESLFLSRAFYSLFFLLLNFNLKINK